MRLVVNWLTRLPAYFWSGWGAVASLLLMLALWDALALHFGALILPSPHETLAALRELGDALQGRVDRLEIGLSEQRSKTVVEVLPAPAAEGESAPAQNA